MLVKPMAVPNRAETQLAYKLKYFPSAFLSAAAQRLLFRNHIVPLTKALVIEHINTARTHLFFGGKEYKIVWAHNNIPTEQEWEKLSADQNIVVELRKSPAIPERYVAIFSLVNSWRNYHG
mgnify:CR=1 FL=1